MSIQTHVYIQVEHTHKKYTYEGINLYQCLFVIIKKIHMHLNP